MILDALSAFDVAKSDIVCGHVLEDPEKSKYLNPIRDLIYEVEELSFLTEHGLELLMLGNGKGI